MPDYTYAEIAGMIDHSLLQPVLTDPDLEKGCRSAREYEVASVCIKPYAARKAADAAQEAGLAEPLTKGSVVASDAFFPFADGLLVAIEAGATAVIQPGGSMRDDEVIEAADHAGLAMVFTGLRHFRH